MIALPETEIVVLDIAGSWARVACSTQGDEAKLAKLGFVVEKGQMVRPIADAPDRQRLANALVGLGALFSGGRDWSPAELVDYYREQGVVRGAYRVITWKSPEQYLIFDR